MKSLHQYFNPKTFIRIMDRILPFAVVTSAICITVGLYIAIFASPEDYLQKDAVRIMYVHVPSAWFALFLYSLTAIFSACYLIWKNPLSYIIAKSGASTGIVFAALALITGSIWGKPMWGTWWVWDARLTSMLILFLFYAGYVTCSNLTMTNEKSIMSVSILALVGIINVPIVKFSVDLWSTLHQPSSTLRKEGIAIHADMLLPLGLITIGILGYILSVMIIKIKTEYNRYKISKIMMMEKQI